jgi:hypothetical protein
MDGEVIEGDIGALGDIVQLPVPGAVGEVAVTDAVMGVPV